MEKHPFLGREIGNYRIMAEINSGAFGSVYRAEHTYLQKRVVAIKFLHAYMGSSQEREQFVQEAQFLATLKHPHILTLIDFGMSQSQPYMISEYAAGRSLRERLQQQPPLSIKEILTILSQVGQALHYAHSHNIIHRDLKPENILFDAQGEVLLADFGIATILSTTSVKQGTIIGTPSYMAPEQFQGIVSKESDQYALACIAYELFTGRKPFTAPDIFSLGFKHLQEQPPLPSQFNRQIPPKSEAALLKAMSKQRNERHASVEAFITALQQSFLQPTVVPQPEKTKQEWLQIGLEHYRAQRYQEALTSYQQAIRLDPGYAIAYNNKGVALRMLKRYQEAIVAYQQTIDLDPSYTDAYNGKGIALYDLKRYQEAIAAFDQAINLDPSDADAHFNKGNALYDIEHYQEALTAYQQAIDLDPSYADTYLNKGDVLYDLKRYQEAMTAYGRAILLDPNCADAYNGKGNILYDLKRYQEAIIAYDQAIRLDPNSAFAYNNKGLALYDLERYQEAVAAYDQATFLDPNYSDAYNNKGLAFYGLQRYQEALAAYQRAIDLNSRDVIIYCNKGLALYDLERYQEAITTYDQAILLDPNCSDAYYNKGLALEQLGRHREAQQAYKKAKDLERA